MDPSDLCVTPGSGGSSSSDGNGGHSVNTASSRCLMPSSPTGNAAADDGGSRSSSPSSARRSVSFVDNGLGNRRSASISNLLLVSSGSHGSGGGGSSSRRSGFGGQGSSNRWQAGPSNVQRGQHFPLPGHDIQQQGQQQLSLPYTMQLPPQQYPFQINMTPPPYFSPWLAGAGPRAAYTYAPTAVTIQPAHYNYNQPSGSGGGPLPVDIRRPDATPLSLPPSPARRPVPPLVISAPPANGGRTPALERRETQPPAPAAPTARAFSWPPTVEEESAIWYALHGTSSSSRRRARLPVFRGICSDGAEGQGPPHPSSPPCL